MPFMKYRISSNEDMEASIQEDYDQMEIHRIPVMVALSVTIG